MSGDREAARSERQRARAKQDELDVIKAWQLQQAETVEDLKAWVL